MTDLTEDSKIESLPPRIFILVENPKKSNNLGPILRCAAAFSTAQIVAVGYDKCSTHGSHGAAKHVDLIAFPVLEQAEEYLRAPLESGGCGCVSIVGLVCGASDAYESEGRGVYRDEVNGASLIRVAMGSTVPDNELPPSFPAYSTDLLYSRPSRCATTNATSGRNVCFAIGKRKEGLPSGLAPVCDSFVHIPHMYNPDTLPLLDVQSCLSMTLHHFASWAGYSERTFDGHKFQVAIVQRGRLESSFRKQQEGTTNERQALKEELAAEEKLLDGGTYGNNVFDRVEDEGDY